eukprot:1680951-Amphidinium_carterae.1
MVEVVVSYSCGSCGCAGGDDVVLSLQQLLHKSTPKHFTFMKKTNCLKSLAGPLSPFPRSGSRTVCHLGANCP